MNLSLKESGQCRSFQASQIKEQYASEKLQKEACNMSAEVLLLWKDWPDSLRERFILFTHHRSSK
jgi:hypothetical protein